MTLGSHQITISYFRRAKERKITKRKSDGEGAEDQNEGSLSPQSFTS